ncbi:MAG: MBL fold metallo-hydrolase [Peptostreptococcaceae bacterium]|nr:MBL fold metallo-hydrolase [Peptostreptococcaceae bacterium]
MLKITYLFHSGITIETERYFLVFDYFKDNCSKQKMKDCGQLCEKSFPANKKVIFFVSHSHYDHYDKEIFRLINDASYVISNDVKVNDAPNIKVCGPYETFGFSGLNIKTFGSTDEGISFLVHLEGKNIFHAGDLNWWHWEGETDTERAHAKEIFFDEMSKIHKEKIDIAFFPVDPRLEKAYYYGGEKFIEDMRPKHFIPLHFQDCFSITTKFKDHMDRKGSDTIVHSINKRGEVVPID